MDTLKKTAVFLSIFLVTATAGAQSGESPLRIFGYFQNSFQQQQNNLEADENSFSLQQLNLFFQKDLAPNWRAFVNFEFLNNFSASRQWGAANLEEAWVRFRANEKFNLKFGLMIPIFNNLNEIKNRTPLLPYIIRPIAYETSFNEFVAVEEYTPSRAFLQFYGFLPFGDAKFDYALYLGNSPNINHQSEEGQTGVDSTDTFLGGGRMGFRYNEWKIGLSYTRENDNQLQGLLELLGGSPARFAEVPRTRLGGDLSVHFGKLSFEGELITFKIADDSEADLERNFYYGTLGYRLTEQLFAYASYWKVNDALELFEKDFERVKFKIPTIGISYNLNDRIVFKGQYAFAKIRGEVTPLNEPDKIVVVEKIRLFGIATSVIF